MDGRETELERMREALRISIERSTLRAVAVQVGMSPTGLQKFVSGSNPYGGWSERPLNPIAECCRFSTPWRRSTRRQGCSRRTGQGACGKG